MSHLVVSITVYMLAQSQGSSYMHVIARLCRMCYEVLRAHACSACAHASQVHSHSKLHSLQTLLHKCFSNQVDVKGHGIANLFSTIHNNSSHKHTASNTANTSSVLTDQSTIGRSTAKTSTSIVSFFKFSALMLCYCFVLHSLDQALRHLPGILLLRARFLTTPQ